MAQRHLWLVGDGLPSRTSGGHHHPPSPQVAKPSILIFPPVLAASTASDSLSARPRADVAVPKYLAAICQGALLK
eukprot:6452042-Amphidinium_carterae.1